MMTDTQIILKYGQPGERLVTITLPYKMRLAWEPHTFIERITCHELIAAQLIAVFNDLLNHYGYEKLVELGIDLYGGCYNKRLMRGSKTKWSRHSWGIAIDLSPDKNALRTIWKNAQFSKPEYNFLISTFYKHGFFNLGKEAGFDAMHFEVAS